MAREGKSLHMSEEDFAELIGKTFDDMKGKDKIAFAAYIWLVTFNKDTFAFRYQTTEEIELKASEIKKELAGNPATRQILCPRIGDSYFGWGF